MGIQGVDVTYAIQFFVDSKLIFLFILRNFCHKISENLIFLGFLRQKQTLPFFPFFYRFEVYDVIMTSHGN